MQQMHMEKSAAKSECTRDGRAVLVPGNARGSRLNANSIATKQVHVDRWASKKLRGVLI